jgi:hypothetical protein
MVDVVETELSSQCRVWQDGTFDVDMKSVSCWRDWAEIWSDNFITTLSQTRSKQMRAHYFESVLRQDRWITIQAVTREGEATIVSWLPSYRQVLSRPEMLPPGNTLRSSVRSEARAFTHSSDYMTDVSKQ